MKKNYLLIPPYAAACFLAAWFAFLLRFDFALEADERACLYYAVTVFLPVKLILFRYFGFYRTWWRMAGVSDLITLCAANLTGSIVCGIAAFLYFGGGFPRSVYLLDFLLCFLLTAAIPISARIRLEFQQSGIKSNSAQKNVLIYGAGEAGIALLNQTRRNLSLGYKVVGFLDDDSRKRGGPLLGLRVLGSGREAARIVQLLGRRGTQVAEIIIAMPSATSMQLREAAANCRAAGVVVKNVPGMQELLLGNVSDKLIREVRVDELLGRKPVRLNETEIREQLEGQSVMVTGGAGSIGSELCRQIASYGPSRLVVFDQAESDLFMIDGELKVKFPSCVTIPVVGDICDPHRVQAAIVQYGVQVIYHAAAYKHVPLMESNIIEAVRNNIMGTYNVAEAAHKHGVRRFLMISSDKAVNPTSIMGSTKRAAEIILSAMFPAEAGSRTTYVSVRFGNVLGSKGSVVPIFNQQIAAGGPVTVTHPDMQRYFMTIPEAVQLVLQASIMGHGSEIFVLDMGEPIKIVDLARNLIKLAGFVPHEEIEIRYTGLREGEKLFEELRVSGEDVMPTFHDKIKIFKANTPGAREVAEWLDELALQLGRGDAEEILRHLQIMVPEYARAQRKQRGRRQLAAMSG